MSAELHRDRPPTLAEVRAHEARGGGFAGGDWIFQPMSIVADELSPEVWHIRTTPDGEFFARHSGLATPSYGRVYARLPEGRWWCWSNGPVAWPEVTK